MQRLKVNYGINSDVVDMSVPGGVMSRTVAEEP